MPYTLNAIQCPVPPVFSGVYNPTSGPLTSQLFATGDTTTVPGDLNENGARADLTGRFGGGGYAVVHGLDISAGAGLNVSVAAGQAMIDGIVTVPSVQTVAVAASIARGYLWLSRAGTISVVNNSLTPPAGAQCFLGSFVTDGSGVTSVDQSGIMLLKGGKLFRRTADTATPADSPPAQLQFFHRTANCLFFWDGTQYWELAPGNSAFSQLVLQPSGNVALTAAQALYTNIELRSGGGVSGNFYLTFPAGMTAGREWTIRNTTGQPCIVEVSGGADSFLGNGLTRHYYYDGTELREVARGLPSKESLSFSGPTKTFTYYGEVDWDYFQIAPAISSLTANWPNAGATENRGRHQTVECDHTSLMLTVLTNGAPENTGTKLLPGERQHCVLNGAGQIVRSNTRPYTQRAAISIGSDADYTVAHPDFLAFLLEVASSVSLTDTRAFILPTLDDKVWWVFNNTTGGQALTVKTAAGTGITLANANGCFVYCDGTNIYRLTASTVRT